MNSSQRVDHYAQPYGVGDIIGCFIYLSEDMSGNNNKISFYKNGIDQGEAYTGKDVPNGVYFPAVSVYMKVCIARIHKYASSLRKFLGKCASKLWSQLHFAAFITRWACQRRLRAAAHELR